MLSNAILVSTLSNLGLILLAALGVCCRHSGI